MIIDNSFDLDKLEASKVYFLSLSLLGANGKLTKPNDDRPFTFWDTIRNTSPSSSPGWESLNVDAGSRGPTDSGLPTTPADDADNGSESGPVVIHDSGLRLVSLGGIAIIVSAFVVNLDAQ